VVIPYAVVFDCDGTIADTESLSSRAWTEALDEHGYTATDDDFRAVIGHPFPQNWAYFSRRVDLGDRDQFRDGLRTRFRALLDTDLQVHPDAQETIRRLAACSVPLAVASSSSHAHVERVLDHAGVRALVAAVIGADDVAHAKPAPDPYLDACARLEVDPTRSTAVEDTAVGVASATAAGLFTVGVLRVHTRREDLVDANRVVERVTVEALVPPQAP
ncbi:MAG: HAD family phosphatase, partial [Nitriliruptoraceae bacterium]